MDMPAARQSAGAVLASSACSGGIATAISARHIETRRCAAAMVQLRDRRQPSSRTGRKWQLVTAWASVSSAEPQPASSAEPQPALAVSADEAQLSVDTVIYEGSAPAQQDDAVNHDNPTAVRRPQKAR